MVLILHKYPHLPLHQQPIEGENDDGVRQYFSRDLSH